MLSCISNITSNIFIYIYIYINPVNIFLYIQNSIDIIDLNSLVSILSISLLNYYDTRLYNILKVNGYHRFIVYLDW